MAGKAFCIAALLTATMSVVFRSIGATSYIVGDSFGWNLPSNGSTYSTWASGKTFHVGDILVFNFVTGNHDVASVTQSDYNSCNTGSPISMMTTSPVDYLLNVTGTYYFICTHDSHCSQGQKLEVTVNVSNGTTYTPPPPPPPPPRSSATSPSDASAVALCIACVVLLKFVF